MKKTVLTLFVISALYFVLSTDVHAQTLTSDRAYQDYQYNLTNYTQSYSDYTDSKNAYLANQTLALKEDARQKTLAMLKNRDQLLIVYITAIRAKITEISGLSGDDKNNIFGKIDTEVSWYKDHQNSYNPDDDLPTLFNKNGDAQNRYKNNTSPIIYEALFDVSLGSEIDFRQSHEKVYDGLKDIINQGVKDGKYTLDPFNHWFTDIDSVDQTLKNNEGQARNQISQVYGQYFSAVSGYNSAIQTLTTSIKPLLQFNQFLSEVITYLKNQP